MPRQAKPSKTMPEEMGRFAKSPWLGRRMALMLLALLIVELEHQALATHAYQLVVREEDYCCTTSTTTPQRGLEAGGAIK